MRRIFIAAFIATGFTVSTLGGTAVTHDEWTELLRTSRCAEDLIVLTNGSKLCGKLTELPPLTFSFGTLAFAPEEVAAIGIISRDKQVKVQYMTYDGQNFIGSLSGKKFVLALRDTHDQQHFIRRELDGSEISFILLAKTTTQPIVKNRSLFHISLQNGDHLSARIESSVLHLTDGWNEQTIDPQNIVEVCFNGGIHGQITKNGISQELTYHFVKEPTISIQVPRKDLLVRLPWNQIDTILATNLDDEWPEEVLNPSTALSVVTESPKPAAIGNTFGKMLSEASGAITVPPQMFVTLDDIGNDTIDTVEEIQEPPALFTTNEEATWTLDIAFNEEPAPLFNDSEEDSWKQNIAFNDSEEDLWNQNIAFAEEPEPLFNDSEEDSWKQNIAFESSNEQLFDHSEESTWGMHIAFEEEIIPEEVSSQDFAMLDQRELNDLYKRYDMKQASAKIEDDQLEETLAEVEQEEELIEELAALDVEDDATDETEAEEVDVEEEVEVEQPDETLAEAEQPEEVEPEQPDETLAEADQPEEIEAEQPDETLAEADQPEEIEAEQPDETLAEAEQPDETLAEADQPEEVDAEEEDDLSEELAILDAEDEEIIPGYFVAEDYIVLPVNSRGCTGYQTTFLPTDPEPLSYVKVPAYFIDESPVTNGEYAKFVQETGYPAPKNWEGSEAPQGLENDPVSFVSYDDAAAYAAWLGRRLPTEIEWSIALENGLIQTDESHPEWTSTPAADNKKVVILEKGTLEISPNHIDRGTTFRTLQSR